jgi:hypothetical protein
MNTNVYIIPEILKDEILVVTIGSKRRPASQEDIDVMKDYIEEAINTGKTELVVHHSIKFKKLKKLKPGYTRVLMIGDDDYPASYDDLLHAQEQLEIISKKQMKIFIIPHRYKFMDVKF